MSGQQNAIISFNSRNQEVIEYPQKHASILDAQKLYWVRLANSAGHDYLILVQLNLVDMYFYSRQSLLLVSFDFHVVRQVDKGTYTIHLRVLWFLLDVFCPVERCLV